MVSVGVGDNVGIMVNVRVMVSKLLWPDYGQGGFWVIVRVRVMVGVVLRT